MGEPLDWSFSETLLPVPQSAAAARNLVATALLRHQLGHRLSEPRLVVSELAANAIFHAGTLFTVTARRRGHLLELLVSDGSNEVPVRRPRGAIDQPGLGIYIIDTFADEWGVEMDGGHGKTVWAAFNVPDFAPTVGE